MTKPDNFSMDDLLSMVRNVKPQSASELWVTPRVAQEIRNADFKAAYEPENPILRGASTYLGFKVVVMDLPPEQVLDWSDCRSPSRAKRRHAKGIKQRVRVTYRDCSYLVDREAVSRRFRAHFEHAAIRALMG